MSLEAILKGLAATLVICALGVAMVLLIAWIDNPMWFLGGAGFLWIWLMAAMHFSRR
jgi:hypothetical protein